MKCWKNKINIDKRSNPISNMGSFDYWWRRFSFTKFIQDGACMSRMGPHMNFSGPKEILAKSHENLDPCRER